VKKPKPTKKAQERISPTEALSLLRQEFSAMDAAARLTNAVHNNSCRLWCDGNLIKPHIAVTLMVVPRLADDGRWTADIVSAAREPWERPSYRWEFEIEEVKALVPPPSQPQQKTGPQPTKRRPGPLPTEDWPKHVAREIVRALRGGKPIPTAAELAQSCEDNLGYQPDIRAVQRHIEHLLNKLLD
jgi:hypothetical protein